MAPPARGRRCFGGRGGSWRRHRRQRWVLFEPNQGLSGSARLYGDVEYRGAGLHKSSGSYYGFVDDATGSATIDDVTIAPPYAWRP